MKETDAGNPPAALAAAGTGPTQELDGSSQAGVSAPISADTVTWYKIGMSAVEGEGVPLDQTSMWAHNADILSGMRFSATIQMRTPLRVLEHHGELHSNPKSAPPAYAREPWEGMWVPQTKSFREMGIDLPEMDGRQMASEVGTIPADGGDYLPFLKKVRRIVESYRTIDQRVGELRALLAEPRYAEYVSKSGGADRIINNFFPTFLSTIPGLPAATANSLRDQGLDTADMLAAAPDATLLAVKGIGPSKLKTLRARCEEINEGRSHPRIDAVRR
ncbi:helix-hairpin-helix domain-containing protein [Herbaspirillum sp. GCM10030257]|uniref:helix-hairpin-helix domain-containing protein n=1 Tax=Herbaspirillum sp. GCM10030257 TaxID=3273393 RepID=UPI003613BEEA